MMPASEFTLPFAPHDQGWLDLRELLASAAREIHFSAVSSETRHGPALLMIARNLAALAMSIPMLSAQRSGQVAPGALVEASTLLAAQVLQHCPYRSGDDSGRKQIVRQKNA
jgi:hypothetical protein